MKFTKFLLAAFMIVLTGEVSAQTSKEIAKERKEIRKISKSDFNEKASKSARKEAKRLKKEGWEVAPGALPMEKQLDRAYLMQQEFDNNLFPKYLMGEAMSIGENYDAAKMQALELAKQNLAGHIQTEVVALIENTIANKQILPEEAASITQSISAGKNIISQKIGRVITIVEVYRTLRNKNKEVLVRIAYNAEMAKAAAKQVIQDELRQKGETLQNKLNQILGW